MAFTTINKSSEHFNTVLYTGNATERDITTGLTTTDLVWNKRRDANGNHMLYDKVRGINKDINPDLSEAEETQVGTVTAFGTNTFSMGTHGGTNATGESRVAWCWSESATAGLDIVSYTGNSNDDDTQHVSHSLSAVPRFIIIKATTEGEHWAVYHAGTTASKMMYLNLPNAEETTQFGTDPTSSVFQVGTNIMVNGDTETYIAYCFSEVQGFSKFGAYSGNDSAAGAFIYTGFKPAMVILKCNSNASTPWTIWDNKRTGYNVTNLRIRPDTNDDEDTSTADPIDLLSNGFKCRGSNDDTNKAGSTYTYMAWAEFPFVSSSGTPITAG